MIGITNDVGLLRVLVPDIYMAVVASLVILIFVVLARTGIAAAGKAEGFGYEKVAASRRRVSHAGLWIWVLVLAAVAWHAASVAFSLRIPRSDTDASAVYRQMDGLTQERNR